MKCAVIFMMLAGLACNKDEVNVLASAQSLCNSDLAWLEEIIVKADEDKATGKYQHQYMGRIYLTNYNNAPAFLVDMSMYSGGIAYYAFDCSGSRLYPITVNGGRDEFSYKAINEGKILYSNMP